MMNRHTETKRESNRGMRERGECLEGSLELFLCPRLWALLSHFFSVSIQ